jgi:putative hemolysin
MHGQRRRDLAAALPAVAPCVAFPDEPATGLVGPLFLVATVAAAGVASFGALAMASLIAYSPTRLAQLLEEEGEADPAGRTAAIDRRDDEYLVVAAALVAAGWIGGLGAIARGAPAWAGVAFVVAMLLLGSSLPIAVARLRAERTLVMVLPVVHALWLALRWPLVVPILAVTRLGLRLLGLRIQAPHDPAEVQRQVVAAVADTVTDAPLAQEERTWIGNIVGLKELPVSTLMTPRPDIVAFPEAMAVRDAVQKALEQGFSRYPVYRDRIDEVVGVFYVKDALRLLLDETARSGTTTLRAMLRETIFVPETTRAAQLLRRFQAGNQHMAIVIDEYGTTVGLVTVEDVLEQIVGEIEDEYDPPPQATGDEQIRVVETGRVLEFPARTTVAEINALLGTELPEQGDWETVAGLVIARTNHIPVVDETVTIDGVEFRVLQADERRIRRLRATALAPQPAEGAR